MKKIENVGSPYFCCTIATVYFHIVAIVILNHYVANSVKTSLARL